MMSREEAREFASRWLPAWTGNKPEELADYYSGDCFYLDPGIPVGEKVITCIGVCVVQFDEQGKIRRNEVYFDRTELVAEIYRLRNEAGAKGR